MARIVRGRGWNGGDWGCYNLLSHPASLHLPLHRVYGRVCAEMLTATPQVVLGSLTPRPKLSTLRILNFHLNT